MGRVHVSVVRHLAWVSAANLSPVRTQTHSMQDISTSVGVSSVSQHAFCAHGSEWGGKISTRISYLVISEDNSSVTAAHIDESWCSQHFRPPPVSEKTNNGCQQQLHLLHQCWERRAETDSSLYRSVLQRSFKNIFELKSMEVTEERRDTAERIQNIWCFLMTVKVSSYQKVSQRSLHVLSVLHH